MYTIKTFLNLFKSLSGKAFRTDKVVQVLHFTKQQLQLKTALRTASKKQINKKSLLTQGDLLPRVCWQQEDQQGQGGDEDTGDEQIQAVIKRSSAHHHREGHVRVGLLTAVVETFISPSRDLCIKPTPPGI